MKDMILVLAVAFLFIYGLGYIVCRAINVCAEEEERELSGLIEED